MTVLSNTYPPDWTEQKRKDVLALLPKETVARLRQEWETPPDFWEAVNRFFDFTGDACAMPHNAKCPLFLSPDDDALSSDWDTLGPRVWCNPGFARVEPWHYRCWHEALKNNQTVVQIGLAGASQEWYGFAEQYADEIVHLSSRVQYLAPWPIEQSSNSRESFMYIYRRKLVINRPAVHSLWNWKAYNREHRNDEGEE